MIHHINEELLELTEMYNQLQQSQECYNNIKNYVSKHKQGCYKHTSYYLLEHKDDDVEIQSVIKAMNFYRRKVYNLSNAIIKIVGYMVSKRVSYPVSEKCECW